MKPYYVYFNPTTKENRLESSILVDTEARDWVIVMVFWADHAPSAGCIYAYLTKDPDILPCLNSLAERNGA